MLSSSKKSVRLVEMSRISFYGIPLISIIRASCSASLSPGKIGMPVNSSATMHPKLHMSIAYVYGIPSIISGAR